MESFRLNSRIVEDNKEFLIQTVNDDRQGVVRTSLFVNGEFLDADSLPHAEEATEEQVLELVKSAHGDKKSELEYLLRSYRDVLERGTPEMMCQLGMALHYKRMYGEAIRLFRTAVKLRDSYNDAYFFLSQAEMGAKNYEGAIQAGEKAIELKPMYADYHNNLGEAYLAAGKCTRAAEEFADAVKRNVYYADAYFNQAITIVVNGITHEDFELAQNLKAKAIDLLKKATLINPFFKNADYNEAVAAIRGDDFDQARQLLLRIREDNKEKQRLEKAAYFHRFLMYTDWLNGDNIAERIRYLKREIEKNPGYVDLYHELAVCYLHKSKFEWSRGIEYFKEALQINPELKKAQRSLDLSEDYYMKMADAVYDITEKES